MNKVAAFLCGFILIFGAAGSGWAYPFEDFIDFWSLDGSNYGEFAAADHPWDAVLLNQYRNSPFSFTHDISDDVDLSTDAVTEAWLELDFTNMDLFEPDDDLIYQFPSGYWLGDFREFVVYALDDEGWQFIGEIDEDEDPPSSADDVYTAMVEIGMLNDDGLLDVQIHVFNFGLNPATISLDHSKLYGNAEPVPEPATMLLLGSGLVGLAAFGRRKLEK
jgi:hypothetical protein